MFEMFAVSFSVSSTRVGTWTGVRIRVHFCWIWNWLGFREFWYQVMFTDLLPRSTSYYKSS